MELADSEVPLLHLPFPANSVIFETNPNFQIYSKIYIYDNFQREYILFEGLLNCKCSSEVGLVEKNSLERVRKRLEDDNSRFDQNMNSVINVTIKDNNLSERMPIDVGNCENIFELDRNQKNASSRDEISNIYFDSYNNYTNIGNYIDDSITFENVTSTDINNYQSTTNEECLNIQNNYILSGFSNNQIHSESVNEQVNNLYTNENGIINDIECVNPYTEVDYVNLLTGSENITFSKEIDLFSVEETNLEDSVKKSPTKCDKIMLSSTMNRDMYNKPGHSYLFHDFSVDDIESSVDIGDHPYYENQDGDIDPGVDIKREMITDTRKIDTECRLCGRKCRSINALNHHMLVHSEERPYVCEICQKAFKEQPTLRRHMWTHMAKQHQCDICKKYFVEKSSLRRHMSTIHADFKPGVKYNTSNTKQQYCCGKCGKVFKSVTKYTMHAQMHGNPNFECEVCGKVYAGRSHLKIHQRIHTGEKPFMCTLCEAKFAFKHVLKSHQARIHQRVNKFKCNICSLAFVKKSDLSNHVSCHMINIRKGKRHCSPPKHSKKCSNLEMKKCFMKNMSNYDGDASKNSTFALFGQLVDIVPKQEEIPQESCDMDVVDFTIDKIDNDANFARVESKTFHEAKDQERKDKKCKKCLKEFERMGDLKRHLISHIVQEIVSTTKDSENSILFYKCVVCDQPPFRQVDKFKAHLREHAMLTLYKCKFCQRAFGDSSNYSKHKKVHGNKYLQCDMCRRKFNTKRMLITHMEYHNHNKPTSCVYCNKVFYFESNLRKHLKMSHQGKANVTYKCESCGGRFRSVKQKWEHQWDVHKIRKVKADCDMCDAQFRKISLLRAHTMKEHVGKMFANNMASVSVKHENITFTGDPKLGVFIEDIL